MGFLDEAIATYKKAIRLMPDQPATRKWIANHSKIFKIKVRLLYPDRPLACSNIGLPLYRKKFLDQAIAAYKDAIRLIPDDARVHNNLGCTLKDKGLVEEAIAAFQEAIRLKPDY